MVSTTSNHSGEITVYTLYIVAIGLYTPCFQLGGVGKLSFQVPFSEDLAFSTSLGEETSEEKVMDDEDVGTWQAS